MNSFIFRDTPAAEKEITRALQQGVPFLAVGRAARVLATQLGGVVEPMLSREEKGDTEIYRLSVAAQDPLFSQMPETFTAPCFRVDDITQLPLQAVPLANSERTQFMAFKIAGKPVYAVQFEPSEGFVQRFIFVAKQLCT